jgi:hypothetical protein
MDQQQTEPVTDPLLGKEKMRENYAKNGGDRGGKV